MDQDFNDTEHAHEGPEGAAADADNAHTDGHGVDLHERVSRLHDATEAHFNRLRQQ
jgi:hypothetical protein